MSIKRWRRWPSSRLQGVGFAFIVAGLIGMATSLVLYNQQPKPPKNLRTVNVASAPSAVKPSVNAVATYSVPPAQPKYVSIPAININRARILRLGVLANGQISTPNNIYDTGWYDGSALPGQPGAMFIFGHVSSWTANGVFYNLKKLVPGDSIVITRGDNRQFTYRVVTSRVYPYNNVDMQQVLSPIAGGKPGLNLMTCTGQIIKGTSEFNERLVVFASLVSS